MGPTPAPAHPPPPGLVLKPGTAWSEVRRRCGELAPEAFADDRVLNLWGGGWRAAGGEPLPATSPVDGTALAGRPVLEPATAREAVSASVDQHRAWRHVPLPERRARVAATLDALSEHRALLALLLVWERGKPWKLARAAVDETVDGVRWFVDNIETMLDGRTPLPGPIGNADLGDQPVSELVHSMLIQALAGNAVIAKSPSDSGTAFLTLASALSVREGLPLALVGCGSGATGAGGSSGASAVTGADDPGERHATDDEQGLNCWGVWDFSDWERLTPLLRGTFEYGKQHRTACSRFVVQRRLFDGFLGAYLPAVRSLRYGHPLAVSPDGDASPYSPSSPWSGEETPCPELDFGPLINAEKAKELAAQIEEAIDRGAVPLYRGSPDGGRFLPGQDTSAYLPPTTLLAPPSSSPLHSAHPFGPVDSIVLVDTEAELLAAMNAGNGALAATLSTDDRDAFERLSPRIRSFKTGQGKPGSRGDRHEVFRGELLVRAFSDGPRDERLPGNFPDHSRRPDTESASWWPDRPPQEAASRQSAWPSPCVAIPR
jgi:hypothetical protein